ncbi:hypothetical protein Ddc_15250 [Ditylenchus destructor]|nr:hypothetical protein Ddc_15250 [Ditylenchus destructor]
MFSLVKLVFFLAFLLWNVGFSDLTQPEYCEDTDKLMEEANKCREKEDSNATLNQLCEPKLKTFTCVEKVVKPCNDDTKNSFGLVITVPSNYRDNAKCVEAVAIVKRNNGTVDKTLQTLPNVEDPTLASTIFSVLTQPEYCKDKLMEEANKCREKADGNATTLNQLCEQKLETFTCVEKVVNPCDDETKKSFNPVITVPSNYLQNTKCVEAVAIAKRKIKIFFIEDPISINTDTTTVTNSTDVLPSEQGNLTAAVATDPGNVTTADSMATTDHGNGCGAKYSMRVFAAFGVLGMLNVLFAKCGQNF